MILESDMKNYMYRSFWWRFVKTQSTNHNSHNRRGFCWKVFFLLWYHGKITIFQPPFMEKMFYLEQIQVDVQGFFGGYMFQSEAHQKSRFASTRVEPCLLGGYLILRHTHPGVCLDFLLSNCMFEINMTSPSPNRYQKLEPPLLAKSSTIPINISKKEHQGGGGGGGGGLQFKSLRVIWRFVQDAWRFGSWGKRREQ